MRRRKKAAIQISTNFLVSLIMAILMFMVGLYVISLIPRGGDRICAGDVCLDDGVCDKFGCQPGEDVCIDKNSVTLVKDAATFCLVVSNKYLDKYDFTWDVDGPYLLNSDGSKDPMPNALQANMTSFYVNELGPKRSEKKHILVEKGVDAPSGDYSFNVNVFRKNGAGSEELYETEVFIVKIP